MFLLCTSSVCTSLIPFTSENKMLDTHTIHVKTSGYCNDMFDSFLAFVVILLRVFVFEGFALFFQ